MTIRLSLRKRFKKLIVNPKGFSSVIGTVFMVLVMMVLATSFFLRTLPQNTKYYQAVKEKNQLEVDRLNERVKAFDAVYTVTGNDVSVSAELQNQGPLSVQIMNLWVKDNITGSYNFSKSSVNYLQPGGTATLTATVTIMGLVSEHRFSSWLITGRGNVVPLEEKEKKEEITVADVAAGIGSISMNFTNFKYFDVDDDILQNYPVGDSAFEIETGKDLVLAVYLSNYDILNRSITLSSRSLLWAYFPTAPGNPGLWYITKVDETTGAIVPYSNITLAYGQSKRIFFGPSSTTVKDKSGAVNLILHGMIGTSTYGQNIPFVSIYVTAGK